MRLRNRQSKELFAEMKKSNPRLKGHSEELQRLDLYGELRHEILPLCRLKYGEVWEDPEKGHRVGVLDATRLDDVKKIMGNEKANLIGCVEKWGRTESISNQ